VFIRNLFVAALRMITAKIMVVELRTRMCTHSWEKKRRWNCGGSSNKNQHQIVNCKRKELLDARGNDEKTPLALYFNHW